jgi:BirA family biotin operon repressor/biotin-[acetyl-CoA-carboxylase] ligase
MPRIDPSRLYPLLGPQAGRFDVDVLEQCTSTNTVLLERAARGAPSGSVLVADRQSAGRGRRGRSWLSDPEASLTFSVLWRWPAPPERLAGLSLAVGVAVARGLESLGAQGIGLKWPNDVLCRTPAGPAKLAGILIEMAAEPERLPVVIGIGLNLRAPPDAPWPLASLDDCCAAPPERHAVLAAILQALAPVLARCAADGFAALRAEWQARHVWQDQAVRLMEGERLLAEGICCGADESGALCLETAAGPARFLAGDVSLRVAGAAP